MAITIQFRRGTLSQWTGANPILASGEPGLDLTNMLLKVGDGSRNWNNLPYVSIRLSGGTGIGLSQNPDGSYTISSPLSISGIGLSRTYSNNPSGNYTLSLSTGLQSIANLNIPINNYLYTSGPNTFSTGLITSAGRSLLASNGHTHSVSDITNFGSGVSGLIGSSVVYTTGNQTISGIKTFSSIPNVNGTGVSLSGHKHAISDITDLDKVVFTTGNQNISGTKTFLSESICSGGLSLFANSSSTFGWIPIFDGGDTPDISPQPLSYITRENFKTDLSLVSSDISDFNDAVAAQIPTDLVYTTGNQTIAGIKTFNNSGIFNDGIISNEGIFANLFTNSIGLIGNNNKIFLSAGTGIFLTFHEQDNILEISADVSVEPVSDTIVLRSVGGDIFARNAYFVDLYSNRIISTGGVPFEIYSTNNIILDPSSNSATNNIGNGQNNIIIGSFNDGYGSVLYGEYLPSYNFLCFGANNILEDSSKSFIIGNNSSSLSSNNSIAIGHNALISNSGQMSYSNGKFQYNGDSQKITYLARGVTIDDNSCILTLDGNAISNSNILLVPPETTWAFYGQISAYDYINGYGAAFNIRGGIRRNQSNEIKLIGSFIKESWTEPEIEDIYVSITANDSDNALQLEAFGKNGSNIKWTCELNIIQNSNSGTL